MTETFSPQDSARLPRALAALPRGTHVRLGAGRFVLPEPIMLSNGIELVGEPGGTILDGRRAHGILAINGGDAYVIRGLSFQGGTANWGGAITCGVRTKLVVDECHFADNRATEDGGAVFLRSATDTKIVRCVFDGNAARRGGGGLDLGPGTQVLVDRCIFQRNEAKVGGAVFLNGTGALEIRNCTILDNRAEIEPGGAGLFVRGAASDGPSAYIANSVFGGPDVIAGDPTTKYNVYVTNCIVPTEVFQQHGFKEVGPNVSGPPQLVQVAGGLWGIAPGSAGSCIANAARIEAGATDLLGRPMVCDGVADPGALASTR